MDFATFSHWPKVAIRIADVAITVALVAFTAPLLAGLALMVKLNDGGPVLYRHERIGLGGRRFKCLKFRTMAVDSDQRLRDLLTNDPKARAEWLRDQKLRRDPRVTRIGALLRKSSLDELPQLWNVLIGDMSLVGPRPIVQDEVARYGRYFEAYCSIRPGITGIWQVGGRNDLSYRRRVAMDVIYARNRCLTLYVRVLLQTVPAVLMRRGAH